MASFSGEFLKRPVVDTNGDLFGHLADIVIDTRSGQLVELLVDVSDDIDLTLEKGVLTITGKHKGGSNTRDYTHRGISQRAFERSFTLSETIKVVGADIVDGLLVVILENDIPEEDKPQTINLGDLPKHAKKLLLG